MRAMLTGSLRQFLPADAAALVTAAIQDLEEKTGARPLVQRWTSGGYLHLLVFYALLMVNSPAANRSYQTVGGF
jgi:hypothetical protein